MSRSSADGKVRHRPSSAQDRDRSPPLRSPWRCGARPAPTWLWARARDRCGFDGPFGDVRATSHSGSMSVDEVASADLRTTSGSVEVRALRRQLPHHDHERLGADRRRRRCRRVRRVGHGTGDRRDRRVRTVSGTVKLRRRRRRLRRNRVGHHHHHRPAAPSSSGGVARSEAAEDRCRRRRRLRVSVRSLSGSITVRSR